MRYDERGVLAAVRRARSWALTRKREKRKEVKRTGVRKIFDGVSFSIVSLMVLGIALPVSRAALAHPPQRRWHSRWVTAMAWRQVSQIPHRDASYVFS